MPAESERGFEFRPVTRRDLPLISRWLATPHVSRWWGDPGQELAEIEEHIDGSSLVAPFIILMDGMPVGYIQSYDIHGEDDHPYRDQPAGTIGIDLSIGNPEHVGRGLGPRIIDAFVRRIFSDGAPRVVIDPDPDNIAAIRAYRKAGFRALDRRTSIYGDALFMVRDRERETSVT
jgi:aminoglycoside 6'-N-acetyltransferase